jgi:hypothetical protein
MASAEVSDTQPSDLPRSRGQRSRGGRAPRGRGNRQRNAQFTGRNNEAQGATAAAPVPAVDQSATSTQNDSVPYGRGRRGGRSARRGRATTTGSGHRTTMVAGRTFGGHLTTEPEIEDQSGDASRSLDAGAPVFVPGQPVPQPR